MNIIEGLKLMFAANKLNSAVQNETANGYDWKINATKAVKNLAVTCGAVAAVAVAQYFQIPQNVALLFQWLPESVRTLALGMFAPIIATGVFSLMNWGKNRLNQIVWMVPVQPPSSIVLAGIAAPTPVINALPIPISVKPAIPPATTPTIAKTDVGV